MHTHKHPNFDTNFQKINIHDPTVRKIVVQMVMRLFKNWGIDRAIQCALLGMAESSRPTLLLYEKGERGIPDNVDSLDRVSNLLAIHKNLRILYLNPEDAYRWMSKPNLLFDGLSPAQFIAKHGMRGMYAVRAFLERRRGQ